MICSEWWVWQCWGMKVCQALGTSYYCTASVLGGGGERVLAGGEWNTPPRLWFSQHFIIIQYLTRSGAFQCIIACFIGATSTISFLYSFLSYAFWGTYRVSREFNYIIYDSIVVILCQTKQPLTIVIRACYHCSTVCVCVCVCVSRNEVRSPWVGRKIR